MTSIMYVPAFEFKATVRLTDAEVDTANKVLAELHRRLPGVRYCTLARASSVMRQMYQLHLVINGYVPPPKAEITARVEAIDNIEAVFPQAYFTYRYGPADTPAPELP